MDEELLKEIISDLGLDKPFVRGQKIIIKNCWHFSTDGNTVDAMFYGVEDFIAGMNRIYVTVKSFKVVILAFSLMDTHVHFVLYGEFSECNRFMHEYVRRTSQYIATAHGERHKLDNVPVDYQSVTDDVYLKTVICYTIKNAPVGGIPFMGWDYPWSSGPLYFRRTGLWSSPAWMDQAAYQKNAHFVSRHERLRLLRTKVVPEENVPMIGKIVFPGIYLAYGIVEKIFKTCKSFNYFLCKTKEDDVDARGGTISHLTMPIQEMRQHKTELCLELFGVETVRTLDTRQRLILARALRSRYNSSLKQITRLSGLVYEEVKDLI
ncbi:MAG: hypothetical protein IJ205_00350 [Bacteroidales bacterium]|nr:hypothetical protein [Bacteroidales bacterium]